MLSIGYDTISNLLNAHTFHIEISRLVFLFGVGCAAVASLVLGSGAAVATVTLGGLITYIGGGLARSQKLAAFTAIFSGLFALAELWFIRIGRDIWRYPGGSIPYWLFPLWAGAGVFSIALQDVVTSLMRCLQSVCKFATPLSVKLLPETILTSSLFGMVMLSSAILLVMSGMMHFRADPLILFGFLVGVVAVMWVSMGMEPAVLVACAMVSISFPLLESMACMAGRWEYDRSQLSTILGVQLNVPIWLVPLWSLCFLMIVQSTRLAEQLWIQVA